MEKRLPAIISSIANSFCDFTLDIAINKYNEYTILLYTSLISVFFQIIYSFYAGITLTASSIPIILVYGLVILFGYLSYIQALKRVPIGLAALLESSDLFFVLIIDIILGYLKLTPLFIFLFTIFVISIIWFTSESYKIRDEIKFKKIKLSGILFLILSVLLYTAEPYLIKIASYTNANEVAINFGYSFIAIPFFLFKCVSYKNNKEDSSLNKKGLVLICTIGLLEAIYYLAGTMGYINDTPIIVNIIQEIRVFLLVILSVIFKTDKITLKKAIALLIGMLSIIGICFC